MPSQHREEDQPGLVLVLGMHRGGTSCVAHMLQRAGLFLGDRLMNDVTSSNLAGHWENLDVVAINDRILDFSGGAWDRVPSCLRLDEEILERMRSFLASLRPHRAAGWKDPRTTLTFPAWKPLLPAYRLVVCLRHPMAVARSLQVREGWELEQGLRLWAAYNELLLSYARGERAVCWFNYDLPEQELARSARALCRQLGLRPATGGSFNPFLRHHAEVEPPADPHTRALYEELLAEARAGTPGQGQSSRGHLQRRTATRVRQLAAVTALQSQVQQQQTLRQARLERHSEQTRQAIVAELTRLRGELTALAGLRQELRVLRADVHDLAAGLAECQQFVGRCRNWPLVRLARALARALRGTGAAFRRLLPRRPRMAPAAQQRCSRGRRVGEARS
jgi:hypothetical protein